VHSHPKFLVILGTRPEAIKLAPVIRELRARKQRVKICVTGQHREMLRPHLKALGIKADHSLHALRDEQGLSELAARLLSGLDRVIQKSKPDWVIVQGDSTSAFAGALAAFHLRVKVAHIEAGLRTSDLSTPFPEEMNRRVISLVAALHFAPTGSGADHLRREGIARQNVFITGNTVIDSLHWALARAKKKASTDVVLITAHRRENLALLGELIQATDVLAQRFPATEFLILKHKNPQVARAVAKIQHATVGPPLDYIDFIGTLNGCRFVITDSGGLQEEATALGKPLLVLRASTERIEATTAGIAELIPMSRDAIVRAATRLLEDPSEYARRAQASNVFGDGHAAERIVDHLLASG
jgi:UDP-N-acetylglucosamine 2-epimerase (non-hydrolysing)